MIRSSIVLGMSLLTAGFAAAAPPFPGDVTRTEVATGPTRHAAWLDLEGDGDGDLAVADRQSVVRILRDDGGLFGELGSVPTLSGGGHRVVAGDLDGDGDPDLVVCSRSAKRRPMVGGCTILLNGVRETRDVRFDELPLDLAPRTPRMVPLVADYDGDGDLDILFFPQKGGDGTVLRNDRDGRVLRFTLDSAQPLAGVNRILDAAILDPAGRGTALWVTRRRRPALVLVFDPATGRYRDVARERALSRRSTRGGLAAVGDLDGDRRNDVFVVGTGPRALAFLQNADGTFAQHRLDAVRSAGAVALALDDFDRDGRRDVFVARRRARSQLLRNAGGVPPTFTDVADAAATAAGSAAAATVFRRRAACDDALDLVVASASRTPTRVHRFPDASAARTVAPGGVVAESACVEGTDAAEQLIGHRVASVLRGGGGDDLLVARAGVTVMEGGPGRDTFRADGGFAIVRLPRADVTAGEAVHCGGASEVWIDTPLALSQLQAAGVVFHDCFEDAVCDEPASEFDVACHGGHSRTRFTNSGETAYVLLKQGLDLGFAAAYDFGFGECSTNADCYAIGLDVCRDAYGNVVIPPATGACYPSDFDGLEGPIVEWCSDPFWARARYEQVRALLDADGRRLVIPVVVWIVRSEAATDGGGCTVEGHEEPPSIAAWHDSLTKTMGSSAALYAKWGVAFDYAFRRIDVPADSTFVVDPDSDACRVQLAYSPGADDVNVDRTIGKLLETYPDAYRAGQVNVYLSDTAPTGYGGGASWSNPAKFIILWSDAGALSHEIGHEIGLGHPYSNNLSASGTAPDDAESRDSWVRRPFPDATTDRLHICGNDGGCSGVDAPPGACRKAPGAVLGFCQNLKKDCAENGDDVCDTPWDATPCFQGIDPRLLEVCGSDDDCHKVSAFRGTSYLTECMSGRCRRVQCIANEDCGGDSWCAAGYCVNHKEGFEACCDLYTDRRPGFVHNACFERRPNGTVAAVPGVGTGTTWPLLQNVMGYHSPRGLPKTLTLGQRDTTVCELSYGKRYGQVSRLPRPDGDPCTLRPGGQASSYGPVGVSRLVPHGACASGICQVSHVGGGETSAVCVSSTCSDGLVGAAEASRDCGGVCPTACATFRPDSQSPKTSACEDGADCVSAVCSEGVCHPSCSDGSKDGSELDTDEGGSGFSAGCAGRAVGETCRFDQDCSGAEPLCEDDAECVLATDCPVNQITAPCSEDGDCPGGDCRVLRGVCQLQSCTQNAHCPLSFVCDLPTLRCRCSIDAQCPIFGDSCQVLESACMDECVDGRCLGTCRLAIGGP